MHPPFFIIALVCPLLLLLNPSTGKPTAQADSPPSAQCAADWKTLPYSFVLPLLRAAPPEPSSSEEAQCRRTTAETLSELHGECVDGDTKALPYLSDCYSATDDMLSWLGPPLAGETALTFGDRDGGTCEGVKWCLPLWQDHGNCRALLAFQPEIAGLDRKDEEGQSELGDAVKWLEWRCGVFKYGLLPHSLRSCVDDKSR